MLIVIVMISVLALVAIPRFASINGKRHLESARMRVAAALVTARQAAIQKGQTVQFKLANNRVTVKATDGDTTDLVSPIPLNTLYKVTTTTTVNPLTIDFSSRGFAMLSDNTTKIELDRSGTKDSVVITKTGMVQR